MVKPEWGSKRSCPKCEERFYDLGNEDPCTCVECGNEWTPEPVLKSKQPIPFQSEEKKKDGEQADSDLAAADDELSDVDESNNTPDADVDLGDGDDLGVTKPADEDAAET